MSKDRKSKFSKLKNIKKKSNENYTNITEGMYTAKNFLGNLSKSMGQAPDSLYPKKAHEFFKINNLVDLRLINNRTYIYIDNKRFVQCFNLLFNVAPEKSRSYINIKNMDEASQILGVRYSAWFMRISPKEAFMAHCSNIQAFFENELNTDLLHSDIAFPLLKKLVQLGYQPAEKVFAEEIVKRYNEGTRESRMFLRSEGYLKYLNKEEKRTLKKDKHFRTLTDIRLPKILEKEIAKRTLDKDIDTLEV